VKIRVIIWTITAILVVVGTLFLLLGGKRTQRKIITFKDLQYQTQRTEQNINELFARLAQARAVPLPPGSSQLITEAEAQLNQARDLIEKNKQTTDIKTMGKNLRLAHRLLTKTRRLLRTATRPKPLIGGPGGSGG